MTKFILNCLPHFPDEVLAPKSQWALLNLKFKPAKSVIRLS